MSKRPLLLIIVIVLITLSVLAVVLLGLVKKPPLKPSPIPVVTTEDQKDKSFPDFRYNQPRLFERFFVVSTEPSGRDLQRLSIASPITVVLNNSVDIESLEYKINPLIDLEVKLHTAATRLTFSSKSAWVVGTEYVLTITKAKSQSGLKFDQPFEVRFKAPGGDPYVEPGDVPAETSNNP